MREKELISFILCEWSIIKYDGSYNLVVKKIGQVRLKGPSQHYSHPLVFNLLNVNRS